MGFNVLVVVLVFSLLNICTGRIESPLLQLIRLLELFAGNGYILDSDDSIIVTIRIDYTSLLYSHYAVFDMPLTFVD